MSVGLLRGIYSSQKQAQTLTTGRNRTATPLPITAPIGVIVSKKLLNLHKLHF